MAARALAQRVRIIGGRWKRHMLPFPSLDDLRPTPDRVRETVFNWLGQDMDGLACLDLFAGSGALGFEAASRGARRVVMVEHDARAVRALEDNRDALGPLANGRPAEIVKADALRYLKRAAAHERGGFDVVFLDPPFRLDLLSVLLPEVVHCLAPNGWVYVEGPADGLPEAAIGAEAGWTCVRHARAGAVDYRLLAREVAAQASANPDTLATDARY